ncbi:MAG TPA: class I SAM-dependent methyltransferase [Candidatus Thermoplasmatota archaeon]|nr:class I SAM-dependent methyltransferase [Candidatus Thermoplasmatota archaeon]
MAHVFHRSPKSLDNPERHRYLPARQLLEQMAIKPGDTVLDFGAGIGYFSIPALDLVGERGKVIAIDLSKRMLKELHRHAGGRPNLVLSQARDLGTYTADIILLVTVLHEVDSPKEFLESCFTHLNPGGRVFVIDWQKKETPHGPPLRIRLAKEEVLSMTQRSHRELPISEYFYFLEFW